MNFEYIERALKDGEEFHGFLSGGGLRVVRTNANKYYSESYNVNEAFRILNDDIKAGGRPYHSVYGNDELLYYTGTTETCSELDTFLLQGSKFRFKYLDDNFVVELENFEFPPNLSQDIKEKAFAGETITWEDNRGCKWETAPVVFPNGETGCSSTIVFSPFPDACRSYLIVRTGIGQNLPGAIDAAFKGNKVEKEHTPT